MNYIKNLYSGRIGSLTYLVGSTLSYGGFWFMGEGSKMIPGNSFISIVELIILLALCIFMFSIIVRRLHDLGKSGWLTLLIFVPIVNVILGIILLLKPGNSDSNKYGNPPRGYKYLLQDLLSLNPQ